MAQATATVVILMMALVMATGSVLMVVAAVVTNLGYLVLNPPWARSDNGKKKYILLNKDQ
jgi:hypothetical protein